jgi:hypothetical protein
MAAPSTLSAAPPAGARSSAAAGRDARLEPGLVSAAHQFEASLMQELLRPLGSDPLFDEDGREGEDGLGGLDSPAEGSGGALASFGSEALARALSEKGGIGIARRVLDHFEASAAGEDGRPGSGGKRRSEESAENRRGGGVNY